MEDRVGFFGQFGHVFKGVVKPRFFNRLSNQSNFSLVSYIIIMAFVSVVAFWGITYLKCLGGNGLINQTVNQIKEAPQFSYASGKMEFEESSFFKVGENQRINFVFNSTIADADKAYKDKVEILTDWTVGTTVIAFNGNSIAVISPFGGLFKFKYTNVFNVLQFPASFNREGFINTFRNQFIFYFLIVAGISLIPFVLGAVVMGHLVGAAGFGMNKIIKQPYNYKELFKIAIYVTGFTNIFFSALLASPVKPPFIVMLIIFVLIGAAYMFFAITGSTEEAGPTSKIVFNKPSSGKLSEDIPAPDPFAKKNYSATSFAKKSSIPQESAPAETVSEAVSSPVASAPVASAPVAPSPVIKASTLFTPKVASETTTSTSSYSSASSTESHAGSTLFTPQSGNSDFKNTASADASSSYSDFSSSKKSEPETTSFIDLHTKSDTSYTESTSYSEPEPVYTEPETTYEEPAYTYAEPEQTVYAEPETVTYAEPKPEPASAVIKSDIGTYGGLGSSSSSKKSKPKWDRPITAPDAYNGLYYSGSDSEESYESNYGSGTLLDRGGLYGKTIGAPETASNPFANVLAGKTPTAPAASTSGFSSGALGGSLYSSHTEHTASTEHVAFTTKEGSTPFGNGGFYLSNPPRNGASSTPSTVKKGGKTVNRYSDDDFAAWEREHYAEEFNRPRGGFGNNIF